MKLVYYKYTDTESALQLVKEALDITSLIKIEKFGNMIKIKTSAFGENVDKLNGIFYKAGFYNTLTEASDEHKGTSSDT